jgi:hypothetical protein
MKEIAVLIGIRAVKVGADRGILKEMDASIEKVLDATK